MENENQRDDALEQLAANNRKLRDGKSLDETRDRGRSVDRQFVQELIYGLETVSIGTHQLLYFAGMKYANNYLETDATTVDALIDELAIIFEELNVGSLTKREDEEDISLELADNAVSFDGPDTDTPACYFIAGYIAGFLENGTGDHYAVQETQCSAQDSDTCIFRVRPR